MTSLKKPLGRGGYFLWGSGLMALKVALDYGASLAFGRPFSLAFYLSPADALLLGANPTAPGGSGVTATRLASGYWLALVGIALPFIAAGLVLTARRLRDAGRSPYLALLFFVPLVKFGFFAFLALAPSAARPHTAVVEQGPFRSSTLELGPPPSGRYRDGGRRTLGMFLGILAGAGVGLLAMGVSVGLLREYSAPLMIAAPAVGGFVCTLVYARYCPATPGRTLLTTTVSLLLGLVVLAGAAVEGFGCMAMAAPLFLVEALVGAAVAHALVTSAPRVSQSQIAASLGLLPLAFAANGLSPPPPEDPLPVESSVVVRAPPEVVWKRVIAFPPLARPTEPIFRAGIAAPLAATIDGEGVGAVRRCEFTTGAFVEPIDTWEPGKRLAFAVTAQPDPMTEWTLYPGVRPAHLDGYLRSTRGEFELQPTGDGGTRLIGRTWYQVHMTPVVYWRFWADRVIHAIHMRVLAHVARLAEEDAGRF